MAIEFPCPHCSQLLRVGDDSAGKTAKCPKCSGLAKIPAGDFVASPDAAGGFPLGAPLPGSFGPPTPESFGEAPPAKNPFGEFGGGAPTKPAGGFAPAGEINPYTSPSPVYAPYSPSYGAAGRGCWAWVLRAEQPGEKKSPCKWASR